jgi:hypothetical protein
VTFPLYADEDTMFTRLIVGLRRAGCDVMTVADVNRRGLSDEEQLRWAAEAGRVIMTRNQRDFASLHNRWARHGTDHAGIIVFTEQLVSVERVLAKLLLLQTARGSADMANAILYLNGRPDQRIQ